MSGLKLWDADIDTVIRVNNLKEVTNPIALIKNQPTPDGVLSYEIFGTSSQSRKETMAYIDLHGHYMYPNAAVKLRSYNKTLAEILFGTGLYYFDKKTGQFIKDDVNGTSGPEFLYECWPHVKVKEKTTLTTKEVEKFFQQDRDKLFITKFLVMPPFFRDKNEVTGANMSMGDLNAMYNSIISYTQSIANYTNLFASMTYLTQGRVQQLLVDIYNKIVIEKVKGNPSKFGMLRRAMMSKNIDYSGLMVICAPVLHTNEQSEMMAKYGTVSVPLGRACAMFFPFMVRAVKLWFDRLFIQGGKFPVIQNGKIEYITVTSSYDENAVTKMISRFINSPSSRFDPVELAPNENGVTGKIAFTGRYYKNEIETPVNRPMTMTDLLYIVAKDELADKHVYVTRYPLDNYNGQYPAKIELATTIHTKPMKFGERIYQFYPIIEGDPTNAFIESVGMSNTYLAELGGDLTYHYTWHSHGLCTSDRVRISTVNA